MNVNLTDLDLDTLRKTCDLLTVLPNAHMERAMLGRVIREAEAERTKQQVEEAKQVIIRLANAVDGYGHPDESGCQHAIKAIHLRVLRDLFQKENGNG